MDRRKNSKVNESTGATPAKSMEGRRKVNLLVELFTRLVKEKPLGTFGAIIVLVLLIAGIFAEFLAPYPMAELHLRDAWSPPSTQYILGTDDLGRDLLSRIIHGARVSLVVGLAGTSIATMVSIILGLLSGFFGGKTDMIIQRFVDAWMCFPGMFIMLSLMAVLGPGLGQVIIVLGIRYGIVGSRVVRSAVIGIKENIYVEAARAIGASRLRILYSHILPNIMAPIIVLFSIRMSTMILTEATLSFLGYGIPPPVPSWGGMISGAGRQYMLIAPWLALWPGLALSATVYGINMFGDAVRDILDPRLRGGLGRYGRGRERR